MTDNTAGRPKLTTGPTLSDQAYRALRSDITTGALKPGQRLTERGLAEHLGVSPTPVREALQRLDEAGGQGSHPTGRLRLRKPSRHPRWRSRVIGFRLTLDVRACRNFRRKSIRPGRIRPGPTTTSWAVRTTLVKRYGQTSAIVSER